MIYLKKLPGFTLIELLVVFAILGILTVIGIGNFQNTRIKARDITRKSDILAISKSLEAYVNDHRAYPLSDNGQLVCEPPNTTCDFGDSFQDPNGTLYMAKLPQDPVISNTYVYISNGTTYTIYAALENTQDQDLDKSITELCGGAICNYQLKSSNQL